MSNEGKADTPSKSSKDACSTKSQSASNRPTKAKQPLHQQVLGMLAVPSTHQLANRPTKAKQLLHQQVLRMLGVPATHHPANRPTKAKQLLNQ